MSPRHSQALQLGLPKLRRSKEATPPHAGTYLTTCGSTLVAPPLQQKDDKKPTLNLLGISEHRSH